MAWRTAVIEPRERFEYENLYEFDDNEEKGCCSIL